MSDRGESVSAVQESAGAVASSEVADSAPVSDSAPEPIETTPTKSDDHPNESARDTVARILRESRSAEPAEGEEPEEGLEEAPAPTKPEAKQVRPAKEDASKKGKPAKPQDFQIPAPNRLTLEQKELFHQLPDGLKRATHKLFQDWEAQYTKSMQETTKAGREAQHVVEAIRPYLLEHPELAANGFTESRLAASLIAAHQKLTDPKTARQTWLELGSTPQIGVPKEVLESLQEQLLTPGSQAGDISKHPQFIALQEKLNQITSKIDGAEKSKFDATVSSTVSEMEAVREERDASGRYLHPELHDNAFLERVKPLVSALVVTFPDLGYGEALRRAYHTVKGNGNSTQVNQARFPDQNGQIERARQAAVSVRGRSAPSTVSRGLDELPQEALGSARDTVRWALQQLRRG